MYNINDASWCHSIHCFYGRYKHSSPHFQRNSPPLPQGTVVVGQTKEFGRVSNLLLSLWALVFLTQDSSPVAVFIPLASFKYSPLQQLTS